MSLQRAAAASGALLRNGARAFSSHATSSDYAQVMNQAYEISKTPEVTASSEVGYTSGAPLSTYQRKASAAAPSFARCRRAGGVRRRG
jgi:hypothetical protein